MVLAMVVALLLLALAACMHAVMVEASLRDEDVGRTFMLDVMVEESFRDKQLRLHQR